MDPEARWDALAEPGVPARRGRVRIVLAALAGVAVVLVVTVIVGDLLGANVLPGEKVETGTTGREIYLSTCAQCHRPDGSGDDRIGAPAFAPGGPLAGLSFEERVERIGRGKPLRGMPRFEGKLSADEIRKVAAYTQVLSGTEPEPGVEGVR